MKNAFHKYFLSVVLLLFSVFALILAKSLYPGASDSFGEISSNLSENFTAKQEFFKSSLGANSASQKRFIELTESEESEVLNKESRNNLNLLSGNVFAFLFLIFTWECYLKNKLLSLISENDDSRTVLSKRYIQFETFRI
tara:strand:- start:393 stop:812 length:420 start_codon:yes stop_codon:yes gene_type:complete